MVAATQAVDGCPIRGHEIVAQTHRRGDGSYRSRVFLFDPRADQGGLRVFTASGSEADDAADAAIAEALQFLLLPDAEAPGPGTSHTAVSIRGRMVDIYCDPVDRDRYQAFPFLVEPDGSRTILMQFHLSEAITGGTPAAATRRCIRRLEESLAP